MTYPNLTMRVKIEQEITMPQTQASRFPPRRGSSFVTSGLARLSPFSGRQPWRITPLIAIVLTTITACASLPTNYPRTESTAFAQHESTAIGKRLADAASEHPGESGFAIIRYGNNAFTTRIAMTRLAQQTLDVQYYIWEADDTGRILAENLVLAADRGVRVRLLVDDMNIAGRDSVLASLSAHPNIEIRIFNPFANRNNSMFDFLLDFGRVNHRMHNKILVMDNTLAVIGGRNIGDHYFAVDPETNFRDLDIATAGPAVREISAVFDHFWGGNWAVPVEVLVDHSYTAEDLQAATTQMRQQIAQGNYPYSVDDDVANLTGQLDTLRQKLIWAPGKIVWDDPATLAASGTTGEMIRALNARLQSVESELTIESAYFVVGDKGVEAIRTLCERGVKVRILTNSLASNDVVPAHAGHALYRKQLLQAGAQIFELRPDAGKSKKNLRGESRAGLHTKALVFDRKSVVIGSFNLDPRSANINTEASMYVDSPELAAQVLEYMEEGVQPENSYQVLLDENGDLYWIARVDGKDVRYEHEPETSFGQRFSSGFIQMLPVESQL
jgi:putative cardiolipin synthase